MRLPAFATVYLYVRQVAALVIVLIQASQLRVAIKCLLSTNSRDDTAFNSLQRDVKQVGT